MWYPGQVWYLIVSIPDLCPFITLPSNMHCPVFFFMILLENIVVRQLSYFIQFIHISFKDPRFISSDHQILPTLCLIKFCSVLFCSLIIIGICFGVRVLVMIRLIFIHFTFRSVWVAEWPPFEK